MGANHLYNFGRRHHEEHFCDFFLKIGPVVLEILFKYFLSGALAAPLLGQVEPFVQFR